MDNTAIYVCCHTLCAVPRHKLLHPIQVGTALAKTRFEGWLHDDEGENISEKNRSYCELTAQYWAWKNSCAEHLGFFHYRRYLYPRPNAKMPYKICKQPTEELLNSLHFDSLATLAGQYDVLAPLPEDMHLSVRTHYCTAPHHRAADFELMEQIIKELQPAYVPAIESYFSGSCCYFGNIFVMRRNVFQEYCSWLFPLLSEFDSRADWSNRSPQEKRVDGFLSERLLGVFLTKHCEELSILHLPRVHFEPNTAKRIRRQVINGLLPPGSLRRARVKALVRK